MFANTHFSKYSPRVRPTDLRPSDFCLRRFLKSPVYSHSIENEGTLQQCIFDACQAIRNSSVCFEEV